jgi:hypothetical protein
MSDPSIYQPTLPQPPPGVLPPLTRPPVVLVFAILHLVFAGLGLMGGAWNLFVAIAGNPLLKIGGPTPGMEAQLAMQDKIGWATVVSAILSLLIAVPMIIAGIQMLRDRKNGLKWSNIYAYASLFAKAVGMVLIVVVVMPASREMMDTLMNDPKFPAGMRSTMSGAMTGGAILTVVLSCIYPVLTLVLLNRPAIKEWFASRPN